MDYKKIIKNQELRFRILDFLRFIPDKQMITLQYWLKLGRIPELKNPQRFSEKIQWYKLNYHDDLMTIGADKYLVRDFVKSKGLNNILNELYGVYDKPEDINIEELPEKFVIKTTNGSGTNFLCKNKELFDFKNAKKELIVWLNRNVYGSGREWAYKNIKPRIIIEEFLEEESNDFDGISDYKFFCFNGKPEYIVFDVDRFSGHKRNIYDTSWNNLNIETDVKKISKNKKVPSNLDEMLRIATKLAENFPFVRVDLYSINEKIYFGELTFYPWTGYIHFSPDNFDYILGEKFDIFKLKH